jgi:aminopeptidase N
MITESLADPDVVGILPKMSVATHRTALLRWRGHDQEELRMTVRSLTQTEAEERAALLEVQRYDIDVDLTGLPTGPEVRCTSRVTFTCKRPGATTFVDCAADVVSATLDGEPLPPAAEGRIELRDLKGEHTLVVESVQPRTTDGSGVHRAVDPGDGEVYLWTSFEPDEARFVWACFDQPDLKAPHAFTVTAPSAWTVVSNSGDPAVEEAGDSRRWRFPDTPPLSTYNPVVLAGPFHEIRREVGGHDLGLFARRSLRSILERDADELFTVTSQGLGFYADTFAMPFPQHKYDQVFLPEFGGAMENYGCVSWSDAFLRRTTPTPAENELFVKVLLHEMAHMWFGNIVTMRWWDDLWLNEAFADFACHWSAERATAYTDAWASQIAEERLDAFLADQGPISHPIHQPIADVAQAASIFDSITYPKGAAVLHQLMIYVGEETFIAGMRRYFAEHAWGNTTLQDLIDALAEASGRDLDRWRSGWLETAGTDRLTLEQDGEEFVLVGRGPAEDPRPQVLKVGAYRRAAEGLERFALVQVEVDGARTRVELPSDADLLLVNDEGLTFATARPGAGSRVPLLEAAAELPTPISRAVAVATIWDMLVTGEAAPADVAGCLGRVLLVETSDAVVEPYLLLLGQAAESWAPQAQRQALEADVVRTCRQLAEQDGRRQVALRSVARFGSPEDLAWLADASGDDIDLHWRALVRKAELGALDDGEVQALLARDPDPDAWVRGLTARAAAPGAADKEAVWQAVMVERKVPVSSVGLVMHAFWRPGQEQVLDPYTERYLELLPRMHEGGMIPAMVYTGRGLPRFGIDQGYLDRAVELAQAAAPVVRKTLDEHADELRRMLTARSAG